MANYIALIGAYERDNFGDILFLRVTEKMLAPWPIIGLSLFSSDMSKENGGFIISASSWFDVCGTFLPHSMIFVGGETLTCDLSSAIACNFNQHTVEGFKPLNQHEKEEVALKISWRSGKFPYIAHSKYFKKQKDEPITIAYNSIGGTSFEKNLKSQADEIKNSLLRAKYISVRDTITKNSIENHIGTTVSLNPDIVNTVSDCCTKEVTMGREIIYPLVKHTNGNYLVFQANDDYIKKNNLSKIALVLSDIARKLQCAIVLQPAGIALGHDSFKSQFELQSELFKHHLSNEQVLVQQHRDVWAQVATIADSLCFIGTSLHGRIVAASFAKPRISLENSKVSAYAKTWDGDIQPYDVKIESLAEAVLRAVNIENDILTEHSNKIRIQTKAAFDNLRLSLNIDSFNDKVDIIQREIANIERLAIFNENRKIRDHIFDLVCELSKCKKENHNLEYNLKSIQSSWSWRITNPLRKAKRLFT